MKEVIVPPLRLGTDDMWQGFERVFGSETLERMHGSSVRTSKWRDDKRKVRFTISVDHVPKEVRMFFCGNKLRITTEQHRQVNEAERRIVVTNRMRMHFLGAELFSVKPMFMLHCQGGDTYVSGSVRHHAVLPPPLDMVVESFMAQHSKKQLEHFASVLK
jgi:hypothetical protein